MSNLQTTQKHSDQKGAALLMSLIFLLVLTILGVASMDDALMQGKMSGAMQDANIALQGVETAIRDAETLIDSLIVTTNFGSVNGYYEQDDVVSPWDSATWTNSGSIQASAVAGLAERPRYYIQLAGEITSDDTALGSNQGNDYHEGGGGVVRGFKIVARSTGATGTSQRIVESYYGARF